ncbi:MAG: pre-peptidase C-terminal domain-containing protein [Sphingomonadaceae bacterium]|nr:pre-peptidase C-terminal domain-containing protein [Sphingomonadaceae bacterium]
MIHASLGAVEAPPGVSDEGTLTVNVGGAVSGVIDFTGDTDDVSVSLVAGETYVISLRGLGGNALTDSFLEVLAPNGTVINHDDDGGNGTFSLMTITAATTGTYTIRASSFSNPNDPGTGTWKVNVEQQDAGSDLPAPAQLGYTFGFLQTGSDTDSYTITFEEGKFYTIQLAGGADYESDWADLPEGELDTILRVYDAQGNLVALNDDINFPGDISSALGFLAEEGGTYTIEIDAYPGQTGGYALNVEEVDIGTLNPLDSIDWRSANDVPFVDVGGVPTAYVYFGAPGETFGEPGPSLGWNAYEMQQVMKALEEYEKILGVNYEITTDVNQATFRLFTTESQQFGAYMYPQDPQFGSQQGIAAFNVLSGGWNFDQQQSLEQGGFAFAVILHEFGHGHGLAHPHDNGGGSDIMLGVTGPFDSLGVFDLNQGVYTVMSYNDAWQKNPAGPSPFTADGIDNGWSGTLSAFDIAMLQERYGVLNPTETGDTVYKLNNVNERGTYYECIWDTGGIDSIVASGSRDARIDLTAATIDYSATGGGVVSFLDGIWGGFTIARGVVIENARGRGGNDVLIGNEVANVLSGGEGNDTIMGQAGVDQLRGQGGADQFRLNSLDSGDWDFLADFSQAEGDEITLDGDVYGLDPGNLGPGRFVLGTSALEADDRVIYDAIKGKLYFDVDGSGSATKVLIAKFAPGTDLANTDFLVI